ncbi:ABC transporter ATP-binding protein [Saccharomonospora glauca]|jgi:ABC-type lipoprotein export system ATPase subunit|uniref:ABC-type antimicrobial peptide transport system, ATPase component n=1 Tax=Saccharomonospora glauca K62 TaxID=928724 RepID=I1D2R2_9PSEU|nr:ATP-binding cassette domain-containing protein [Saccharomonospora glauca]EIE99236.1 ABC-type antimicrobial peptide transport system, ATPase component [Saccharomonospora glauca K62]
MTVERTEAASPVRRDLPALCAEGLRRRFSMAGEEIEVLRGATLRADAGEIVTVTGRSGSGKTTLLTVLAGFDIPDEGTVTFHGRPAPGAPWWVCALLPQALGLVEELTCAENVALPLRLRPGVTDTVEATVVAALDEVGMAELADRYPAELSFGQQQRVALARAVVSRPSVLLVDEPTAHLDSASTDAVLALLRRMADEGAAVVAVTHDPAVREVADRRLRLDGGVLVAE